MRIGIFYHDNLLAEKYAKMIEVWLRNREHHPVINEMKGIELAIVLGGDGTILHVANKLAKKEMKVPIIRGNFGTRGFLTNVDPEGIFAILTEFMQGGNHIFVKRSRIEAIVKRNGKEIFREDALNDVVIEKTTSRGISFQFEDVFDDLGEEIKRGDGIILATRTGSTAYNRSVSGPIVVREDQMVVSMISPTDCPWSKVVKANPMRLVMSKFQKGNTRLVLDSRTVMRLTPEDVVSVIKSDKSTIFVEFGDRI